MGRKGYPVEQLNNCDPDFTKAVINDCLVIAQDGRPLTITELRERFNRYFEVCANGNLRPGYESMSLALGVDRTTFWRWRKGQGCTEEWHQECERAAGFIDVYLEQAMLKGKISPPSGIFLAKNWLDYKDNFSFDQKTPEPTERHRRSREEIAAAHGIALGHKEDVTDIDCSWIK